MKCETCRQVITPDCDYNQGRCPHRKPMLNIQPQDPSQAHFYVSLFKSATRIAAALFLIWPGSLVLAGVFFIVAEVLGILEEVV